MCDDMSSPYTECLHSNPCKNAVRVSVGTGLFSACTFICINKKYQRRWDMKLGNTQHNNLTKIVEKWYNNNAQINVLGGYGLKYPLIRNRR